MRYLKIIPLLLLIVAGTAWLLFSFVKAYRPTAEPLQGQIEAQQYAVASKVAGRIDRVLVRKGDTVKRGQLVFTLASPEIEARLAQARAGQDAAEALAAEAERGARRQQVAAARDQWQQAQAAAELTAKTFARLDALYRDGVLAEQKRDEAYAQMQAARHAAAAARQMFLMAEEGSREEEKAAAAGKARMAAGAVAEVEAVAADTTIVSRFDGEVSQVMLQSGELAPQGFPVVTVIDMADVWAVFQVREDELRRFGRGSEFAARIPALGEGTYRFRVSHVAALGDFAIWRSTQSGQDFDMRSFEVEARPVATIAGLRVGMSVLVDR
ncbi:efflux RND transporter periplasmic adaptor subunit [Desulfoprunum benzoelyticum]|uniref:HlyD family secretion protein n=1 Tax=Desulfoprunum benzoelyticum TaxID=1506996 RepID=A0A840UXT2_9BACT|nr:efflux RND transporter periplasmic adaptor subunit [Desulfoprunum benzoelyticum]MBB5349626.1 HlyD family secretion protein [Desulfoprunum benzoelyticum]MBM9531607.1 efflux RND transporter periplasmic adaptor subunit [Desulfoprunum benzoelyticum]